MFKNHSKLQKNYIFFLSLISYNKKLVSADKYKIHLSPQTIQQNVNRLKKLNLTENYNLILTKKILIRKRDYI